MPDNASKPTVKKWFGGGASFEVTHYSYAVENDPFYSSHGQTDLVEAPGLDGRQLSRGFLGVDANGYTLPWSSNVGITMQGTGETLDGEHIMYAGTTGEGKAKFAYGVGGAHAQVTRPFEQIAVDSSVIPYGSKVYVEAYDRVMSADDTGKAIVGNHIDVFAGAQTYANICSLLGGITSSRVGLVDDNVTTGPTSGTDTQTGTSQPDTGSAQTGNVQETAMTGTGTVTCNVLNVRSGPSLSSAVISTVAYGTTLELHAESGDWYRMTSGGKSGWVYKDYVNVQTTDTSAGSTTEQTQGGQTQTQTQTTETIGVGTQVQAIGEYYSTGQRIPGWVKANTYSVIEVDNNKALLGGIISWVNFDDLKIVSGGISAPASTTQTQTQEPASDPQPTQTQTDADGGTGTTQTDQTQTQENDNNQTQQTSNEGDTSLSQTGYVNSSSGLNLRSVPNTDNNSPITCIPYRAWLDITGQADNGWYKVSYQGKEGYVCNTYVTIAEKPAPGAWTWPTTATYISSKFGYRDPLALTNGGTSSSFHRGVDIAGGGGCPIYAAKGGTATRMGFDADGYGNWVQIDHHDGTYTRYAHMSSILFNGNKEVEAGEQIGVEGATGGVTGPHLHFEIRIGGTAKECAVDPLEYISP